MLDYSVTRQYDYICSTIFIPGMPTNANKNSLPPHALPQKWRDVTAEEMYVFVGILLFTGMVELPTFDSYWTSDPLLEMKGFRAIIQSWQLASDGSSSKNNKLNTNRDADDHDRFFEAWAFLNLLLAPWQALYYPGTVNLKSLWRSGKEQHFAHFAEFKFDGSA